MPCCACWLLPLSLNAPIACQATMSSLRGALLLSVGLVSAATFVYTYHGSGGALQGDTGAACGIEGPHKSAAAAPAASKSPAEAGPKQGGSASSRMRTFGPVIRQPALSRHTGSVIMLHGLGDTGNGGCCSCAAARLDWLAPTGAAPTWQGNPPSFLRCLPCVASTCRVLPAGCC